MSLDLQLNKCCHIRDKIPTYHLQLQGKCFRSPGFFFHNINGLIQSAKKGCHVCNLILAELLESQIRDLQRELEDNPQHGTQQLSIDRDYERDVALFHRFPGEYAYIPMVCITKIHMRGLHGG